MQWSRYNRLFRSGQCGCFLYNALSNTLFELDEVYYTLLEGWQDSRTGIATGDEAFLSILQEKKVLVGPGEEDKILLAHQYQRQAACFDTSRLGLTICPTLRCNFRCPYCFEQSQLNGATMPQKTMDRLVDFIKGYKDIRHLSVAWYGGEPLLAFDTICTLTGQLRNLGLTYEKAGLVTNGYLLDEEKINKLNDLMISAIQITLDGPREMHDTRRVLANGGPTFDRILDNITALFDSDYTGLCSIRVNVDRHNIENYIDLRTALLEQFNGKNLAVYPGHVQTSQSHSYDHACTLDIGEWTGFTFDLFQQKGVMPTGGFHPGSNLNSLCTATTHHGFVVGPEGELYKCWEDVGKQGMVIGNINLNEPINNPVLRAQYTIGTNAFCDPECLACDVLPICGGGCANKRLRTKQFKEKGLEYCTPYKNHLIDYLEAYCNTFRAKEICAAIISPGKEKANDKGYRNISPVPEKTTGQPNTVVPPMDQE